MMPSKLLIPLVLAAGLGCHHEGSESSTMTLPKGSESKLAAVRPPELQRPTSRPRDPWVFRSVLDGHARMLTVALSDDCWITYDTQTCGLVKAWKGNVFFTGGVYDTKHGPQPKSVGPAYFSATQPAAVDTTPMLTLADGTAVKPHYVGYVVKGNAVVVSYRYDVPGGKSVEVAEMPERVVVDPATGRPAAAGTGAGAGVPALLRSFVGTGLPAGAVLKVPAWGNAVGEGPASGGGGVRVIELRGTNVGNELRSEIVLPLESGSK